jgi:hypothetical protein
MKYRKESYNKGITYSLLFLDVRKRNAFAARVARSSSF